VLKFGGIGLVLALIPMVFYGFIVKTVFSRKDIENLLNIKCFGSLPAVMMPIVGKKNRIVFRKPNIFKRIYFTMSKKARNKYRDKYSGKHSILDKKVGFRYLESMRTVSSRCEKDMINENYKVLLVTSTLANEGIYRNPTCIVKITTADGKEIVGKEREEKRIYGTNAVRMMTDILQGVMTNGTGVKLQLKNSVSAGKTGTTNDIKDGWFVGYTPYYTTAVWVGYDMPKALDNLAGNTYPGYIWQTFMDVLHEDLAKRDFTLYEDERPREIVDDALKEPEDVEVWNPMLTPTVTPGADVTGTPAPDGPIPTGSIPEQPAESEPMGPVAEVSGTPMPVPEPTPSTGWIEYDDDWWDAQMGESSGGYDDFYD